MKLCRFSSGDDTVRIGLIAGDTAVIDMSATGITSISRLIEDDKAVEKVERIVASQSAIPKHTLSEITLLPPVEKQEVWAAGVTYLRSKKARMEESDFSATAYDRVYEASRPEIFFKSLPEKVVGPEKPVGIRKDSAWNVPEPELALVLNSRGEIAGYTIGNDMSSRDIEGENLLYLPQAKTYRQSCAIGPWIETGPSEEQVRRWAIGIVIERNGKS